MIESLQLSPRKGEPVPASAVVHRTSEAVRLTRVALLLAGGGAIGLVAIVVPPHGVWVLGAWAATGVAAWAVWNQGERIQSITGKCSACEAELTLQDVGVWSSDLWVRCPSCQAPYRVGRPMSPS